jgi:hypothetical protein
MSELVKVLYVALYCKAQHLQDNSVDLCGLSIHITLAI